MRDERDGMGRIVRSFLGSGKRRMEWMRGEGRMYSDSNGEDHEVVIGTQNGNDGVGVEDVDRSRGWSLLLRGLIPDLIWLAVAVVVMVVVQGVVDQVEVRMVPFYAHDFRFWRSSHAGTVPNWVVWAMIALVYVPVILVLPSSRETQVGETSRAGNVQAGSKKNVMRSARFAVWLLVAAFWTSSFTEVIKSVAGEPRPDFAYRCLGLGAQLSDVDANKVFQSDEDCMAKAQELGRSSFGLKDGRRSFPSGHSSESTVGSVFVSLYIAFASSAFSSQDVHGRPRWRSLLVQFSALLPMLFACGVAVSRLLDNRHHPVDVTAGFVLGSVLSVFFFGVAIVRDLGSGGKL